MNKVKAGLAGMLVVMVAASGGAGASGMPVVDIGNIIQATMNQINTYGQRYQDAAEYGQNVTRWMQTLDHYRQQLIRIQGVVMSFGLAQGRPVSKVSPEYMVAEKCGGSVGSGAIAGAIQLNAAGNIVEQQQMLCAEIQRTANARYNYTLDFFQEYMPKLQGELKQLEAQRNSSNNEGNVSGVDSNSLQVANSSEANFQTFQARINAYDSYIAAMESNQRVLSRIALKGQGSPLGTLIKTTSLKGALEVGR